MSNKKTDNVLNDKQAAFVREYLIDLNATQSAIRAGYSKKTAKEQGHRLFTNVHIAAAIKKELGKRSERTTIDSDYVLTTVRDTIERCRQGEPVKYKDGSLVMVETPDGDIAPAWKFDPGAVLKGCEMLGKHLGTWEPSEVGGDDSEPDEAFL